MSFGNRELKRVADLMLERMMAGVPEPEDCHYEETPEFRARMEPLFARARRMERMQKVRRTVASIVLALLTLGGTWLAVDTEVRAVFFQWVREVYEDSVIYRYFNDSKSGALPIFTLSGLPEGYVELGTYKNDDMNTSIFEFNAQLIIFQYYWNSPGAALGINETDYYQEEVSIRGMQGHYYQAKDYDSENELIWIDDGIGITFRISARQEKVDMMELANTVQLTARQ